MIQIPISLGELVDKITILDIKLENITDKEKLSYVEIERKALQTALTEFLARPGVADSLRSITLLKEHLKVTNEALWKIEDRLRLHEHQKAFDEQFVYTARQVYRLNDKRAAYKRQLNEDFNSELREIKDHTKY